MHAAVKRHPRQCPRVVAKGVDRQPRAASRHQPRGVAGRGEAGHGAHVREMLGDIHRRQRDGLVNGLAVVIEAGLGRGEGGRFGAFDHPRHRLGGFHRILAGGGFRRQHHRVGAVEHGVGNIHDFGPGGVGVPHHRFHHLGRGDHAAVEFPGAPDDMLLHSHQRRFANLDRKIATGHHHRVAGADNRVEVGVRGDRLGFFDLGDDGAGRAALPRQSPRLFQIIGGTGERDGEIVHALGAGEFEVADVLLGGGFRRQPAAAQVDALAGAYLAAGDNHAFDPRAFDAGHFKLERFVAEQEAVAGFDLPGERREAGGDFPLVAAILRQQGVDGESIPRREGEGLAAGETGDADLGPLKIGENRHMAAGTLRRGANIGDSRGVFAMAAIGKIEPEHIDPGANQLFDLAVARGPERGDDLGGAQTGRRARMPVHRFPLVLEPSGFRGAQ